MENTRMTTAVKSKFSWPDEERKTLWTKFGINHPNYAQNMTKW